MSVLDSLKRVVTKAAPLLGTALGSPLAGVAVSLLSDAFGGRTTDPDDLLARISSDPDAAVKLKEIETTHAETLAALSLQGYQTEVNDRLDARANAQGKEGAYEWFVNLLAIAVTCGFFIAIAGLMLTTADHTDRDILNMMLGVLGTAWVQVMSFYFGSVQRK